MRDFNKQILAFCMFVTIAFVVVFWIKFVPVIYGTNVEYEYLIEYGSNNFVKIYSYDTKKLYITTSDSISYYLGKDNMKVNYYE